MEYLTVKEMAELKWCSERYIQSCISKGQLEAREKLNSKWKIKFLIPVSALPEELKEALEKPSKVVKKSVERKRLDEFTEAEREQIAMWCGLLRDWQAARDGKFYKKDELPLDHPNGMCTFTAAIPDMNDVADSLADWVNGKDNPELDNYASYLGYEDIGKAKNDVDKSGGSGIIKASGKKSDFEYLKHTYDEIGKINRSNENEVKASLSEFENKYRNSSIEHCRVIAEDGTVYDVHGDKWTVDTTLLGDKMRNSINEHNHVTGESQYSFSFEDLNSSIKEKSAKSIAYDERYRYTISQYSDVDIDALYEAKQKAIENVYDRRINGESIHDDDIHNEIIKETCRLLGINYEREKL